MAQLVSVNVGLPGDVPWRGQMVRTAIWKRPVAARVFAGRLNLVGDGQADLAAHGGEQRAVMVYQLGSYRHWSDFLKRQDFEHGQFGENLTVEGLPDDEVCIGDRYRIGGAVFEVTQPRVTCYRLGIRMDHAQMPALMVAHGRPGFYCRVLQEGEIGAGDAIEKIADGPGRMTVAGIDRLLYTPDRPIEALRRAVQIPALSPGWQTSMARLLNDALASDGGPDAGRAAAAPTWTGMRRLQIVGISGESADVRSFELAAEDGAQLPDGLPGQHIIVKFRPGADARPVLRNYSLCGAPGSGTFRIAVKRVRDGVASNYLHDHAAIGDVLEASAPTGSFVLDADAAPVVLISAGIGITPLLPMLRALAAREASRPREIWWVHSARDGTHHPFARMARDLVAGVKRGRSVVFYSRPSDADRLGADYDVAGRLDLAWLQQAGMPLGATFYLCGPADFMSQVTSKLRDNGVAPSHVRIEAFGPGDTGSAGQIAPHLPDGVAGSGPAVSFVRSGVTVPWDDRFGSLLDLAEACDVPVHWSCRSGVCHSCECGIIDGELDYAPDPLDPPAQGAALICCSRPRTAVTLDL